MTTNGNPSLHKTSSQKVVVAMSGGVDSSVAAALLVEQGYQVVGLMLRLWAEKDGAANRCCTPDAIADARRVAAALDIPFYVRDYKDFFKQTIVNFFIEGYTKGITPNPCVVCNRDVRFDRLLNEAMQLGGDYLATGHYARIRQTPDGLHQLLKGLDASKDQSYILYTVTQERLAHVLFPLGDYTKDEIRRMAKAKNLPIFNRPDSQDLCFLGNGDYRAFLQRRAPQVIQPGPIRNTAGETLGQHQGLAFYTIGQRKGLGISAPQPMYVLQMDPPTNSLIVGPAEELGRRELIAQEVTYISGQPPAEPMQITAKIRYKARETEAILTPLPQAQAHLVFTTPLRDITPGQAVVFFNNEQILGGGIIKRSN
ncbi:MAG: tRNA 2-thiouridine(34) synthase MnmA [Anaerolineae bacterium]|nr:tRNA 2-thiouridine(34) synthase MnmA [Anaerolineae bacterium]